MFQLTFKMLQTMSEQASYSISPIGYVHSPFKQKFAIPRQPALANASGRIEFTSAFSDANTLRGIEQYSHLWLVFLFHENVDQGWTPTVRAPRLGGNVRTGVFATRSTFRPNSLGISAVKNEGITQQGRQLNLLVSGIDLLDGTPIIDIKPYLPYSDSIAEASASLLEANPLPNRPVIFSQQARQQLFCQPHQDLESLIEQCLRQDPRPAYRQSDENDPKTYQFLLYDQDIHWQVQNGNVIVTAIIPNNAIDAV